MITKCNWLQSGHFLQNVIDDKVDNDYKVLLIIKWTMITKCNWLQSGKCLQGVIDYKVDND